RDNVRAQLARVQVHSVGLAKRARCVAAYATTSERNLNAAIVFSGAVAVNPRWATIRSIAAGYVEQNADTRAMQVGAVFPQLEIGTDPDAIARYARTVEELGYDHLAIFDHVLGADSTRPGGWSG